MSELESFFNWQTVKTYLKDRYKVMKETEDMMAFVFSYDDDRTQIVFVHREQSNGGTESVSILSRIGEIVTKRVPAVLEEITPTLAGGIIKSGDNYYVRSTVLLKNLDAQMVADIIKIVAVSADELEKEFVGGDDN